MTLPFTLGIVMVAVYGLSSLALSAVVVMVWSLRLRHIAASAGDILALRVLPAGGALVLTLAVALPAFLIYEPAHAVETIGPIIVVFFLLSVLTAVDGIRRAWLAVAAARALLQDFRQPDEARFQILELSEPMVAVVGAWRPRIIAARRVVDACTDEEFQQVLAHEAAHLSARDNVKLLLVVMSPDVLAWLPTGAAVVAGWRVAAELAADEHATGADARKRVALASALVKVARLSVGSGRPRPELSMAVALDDVGGRVRQLLVPAPLPPRTRLIGSLAAAGVLVVLAAAPLYGFVHEFVELLVAFGR